MTIGVLGSSQTSLVNSGKVKTHDGARPLSGLRRLGQLWVMRFLLRSCSNFRGAFTTTRPGDERSPETFTTREFVSDTCASELIGLTWVCSTDSYSAPEGLQDIQQTRITINLRIRTLRTFPFTLILISRTPITYAYSSKL